MASTQRALVITLCLGFTGPAIAWADDSQESIRDEWIEDPYQPHDTTGTEVRVGSLVGILAVDGNEYTGLGGLVAAGHRWDRLAVDAEYGYLEVTERGPSNLRYGVAHQLGVNVRFEAIRFGSRVVGPNSMAALYLEAGASRQLRIADAVSSSEMRSKRFPSGQANLLSGGFGLMFDHRLEQPRGFPNRVGWQLGWRVIGSPRPEPSHYTTCRGSECTAAARSSGMGDIGLGETSLELSSSIAFTW
jgi:hypothetical protein